MRHAAENGEICDTFHIYFTASSLSYPMLIKASALLINNCICHHQVYAEMKVS